MNQRAREDGVTITLSQGGKTLATFGDGDDSLLASAIAVVREHGRASISLLQRHLRIGYMRAARLMETMEAQKVVSAPEANGNRHVLGVRAAT
ncbi:DNA translocase FtsK [Dyella japonica]|uniref:DNA translocase FtsK n=1 Tax=Dyella japonica TaxID=231455 RepID=UPI003CCCF504